MTTLEVGHAHAHTTAPATVAADSIVCTVVQAHAKVIGAGTIAKAQGIKAGQVKASHAAQQGAAIALSAAITGKNRQGVLAHAAQSQLASLVSPNGHIDFARAIPTVLGADLSYTYEQQVRADGQRVVKRAVWLALGEYLSDLSGKTSEKSGKPTPDARRAIDASKIYAAIQDHADTLRAGLAAAPSLPQ